MCPKCVVGWLQSCQSALLPARLWQSTDIAGRHPTLAKLDRKEAKHLTAMQCSALHWRTMQCRKYLAFNWEDPPNKNMCSNRILLPNSVPPPQANGRFMGTILAKN